MAAIIKLISKIPTKRSSLKCTKRLHHSTGSMDLNYLNKIKNYKQEEQKIVKSKYMKDNELLTVIYGIKKDPYNDNTLSLENSKQLLSDNKIIQNIDGVFIGIDFSDYPYVGYTKFESHYGENSFTQLLTNAENYKCSRVI